MVTRRGSIGTKRAVDAVEAAYSLEGSDEAWLQRILGIAETDLDLGIGTYGFTARQEPSRVVPDSEFVSHHLEPSFYGVVAELNRTAPTELLDELAKSLVRCGGLEQALGPEHPLVRHLRAVGRPSGVVDGFTMYAHDGERGAVVLSAPARRVVHVGPAALSIWHRAGLHFATALRLRRRIRANTAPRVALLTPGGDFADATPALGAQRDARDRLRTEVRRIERARTGALRRDPERSLAMWRGLIDGRWSLIDRWDSDSRRYIAVHQNAPEHPDPRALRPGERTVAHYLGLGASNKEIAFALGIPVGSVATIVRRVVRKLGGRRRSDVIGFARGPTLALRIGDEPIDVLSADATRDHPTLTPEERAILPLVIRGASNVEIARARGTRAKTVANQLHAIYGKIGVSSRAELIAWSAGLRDGLRY